jgi:hypothetical protein
MARHAKDLDHNGIIGRGNQCIIALELRAQEFGFAVFEGPGILLDWGCRSYRNGNRSSTLAAKLTALLNTYAPVAIVVRRRVNLAPDVKRIIVAVTRSIKRVLMPSTARFASVTTKQVRSYFATFGSKTKHEIGGVLSKRFEELAYKLPPKRKPWQSERHGTIIFDAVASGSAFLDSSAHRESS